MPVDRPMRVVTFLAPNVYPVYAYIADYLGRKLGCATELIVGDSHDQFDVLQPDVAFICGLPYVLMTRQNPPSVELLVAPVLQGERFGGRPIYFSDVIVKHDAPSQSFAELRGHSWAYNEEVSQSGYGITRHHLLRMGATNGFFSRVVNAGWHQEAIRMVADGQIDATAIDCQVLMIELRDHPELNNQIKIIDALGPSTIQPVGLVRLMSSSNSPRNLAIAFLIGHAAPSARPQIVVPGMIPIELAMSSSSSRSFSRPLPALMRCTIRSAQLVPSRHGVHWPHDS